MGTNDINLAVFVSDYETYYSLKKDLVHQYKFSQISTNAFGLRHINGAQIDLMPFGDIETNNEITLKNPFTKLKVQGFTEVYSKGILETLFEGNKYYLASIESIVILKLIAFDDNNQRVKDIKDFALICKYYQELEFDIIYQNLDLFGQTSYEFKQISWIVLGRQMFEIIASNDDLFSRINNIIDGAINLNTKIASLMITDVSNETIDEKIQILSYIKIGLNTN